MRNKYLYIFALFLISFIGSYIYVVKPYLLLSNQEWIENNTKEDILKLIEYNLASPLGNKNEALGLACSLKDRFFIEIYLQGISMYSDKEHIVDVKSWCFECLRDITGVDKGNSVKDWNAWYEENKNKI